MVLVLPTQLKSPNGRQECVHAPPQQDFKLWSLDVLICRYVSISANFKQDPTSAFASDEAESTTWTYQAPVSRRKSPFSRLTSLVTGCTAS